MSAAEVGAGWIVGPSRLHRPVPSNIVPSNVEGVGAKQWSACGLTRERVYTMELAGRLWPRLEICRLCLELEQRPAA